MHVKFHLHARIKRLVLLRESCACLFWQAVEGLHPGMRVVHSHFLFLETNLGVSRNFV